MKVSIVDAAFKAAQEATSVTITILLPAVAKGALTEQDWKDIDRPANTYQTFLKRYNKLACFD